MVRLFYLKTLVVLYSLITSQPAFAVEQKQIDVKVNKAMADKSRMVLGTQVQIAGLSDWQEEEIVHLAMVAHEKMLHVHETTDWAKDYPAIDRKVFARSPGVTTVLVVDNTAYISTSVKGGLFIYLAEEHPNRFKRLDPENPCAGAVQTALVNCKTAEGWGHRTGASCGEPWAAQAFCNTESTRSLQGTKIVTINTNNKKGDPNNGKSQIAHPCGDEADKKKYPGEWGCNQFTANLGINVIPENKKPSVKVVADADIVNSALVYH